MKYRFLSILVIVFALSGCATAKGLSEGVVKTASGMVQDTKDFWETLVKTDKWMQKNLW